MHASRWRVGANLGSFLSTLKLSGHDVDVRETSTTATLDAFVSERLTVQGALGAVAAGRLDVEGTRHVIAVLAVDEGAGLRGVVQPHAR